ncbi:60S ribosomal protein L1 (nucleomorph) [Chroomonas mesostigmatica CCMP1168]|uniref:60S ribosomal protein L1 n=1 Tax=Chroomonas mesostigmatica CCMP1168 TaxID=1195612 RepID=J7G2U8_9CRYP|nr:60S ribosomal protein L1 [Chroomonas mesostigmatica CCMP1168]
MSISAVNVYSCIDGVAIDQLKLPDIFSSPIRIDILKFVHLNMAKNKRQVYSVNHSAGMNTSSKSWGTGRAVSRVPRVPGGGTNRSGQGAVTNMCRGGRMFSPTTVWRKWHHKINKNHRKQAIMTAIATSGFVSLVRARGYNLEKIPEIPLVVESSVESMVQTKSGKNLLKYLGVYDEKKKKKFRAGKGKMRNRKFKNYIGPLMIYENNLRCFRNISGIQLCSINSLNLLALAPGGHVGRFCIWTYKSFMKLDLMFSLFKNEKQHKNSNVIPKNLIFSKDLKNFFVSIGKKR